MLEEKLLEEARHHANTAHPVSAAYIRGLCTALDSVRDAVERAEKVRIVAVALRLEGGGFVTKPQPARHADLFKHAGYTPGCPAHREDQGFLTSEGLFVTREEASKLAVKAGQIPAAYAPPRLTSEDLW